MHYLFVHQSMPGQFRHLIAYLTRSGRNDVSFVTGRADIELPGVTKYLYNTPRPAPLSNPYLHRFEQAVRFGREVANILLYTKQQGRTPDVIVAHQGWGEALFIKDILPDTPLLTYSDNYYRTVGSDFDFLGEMAGDLDAVLRTRINDGHLLLSLESCDAAWCPTEWQKQQHPKEFLNKISVVFDGIDTNTVKPRKDARFFLPDGRALSSADEVITYVARDLEPYRGFPSFMRALPKLLKERPRAEVVVVGGDGVSYGIPPRSGRTWRAEMAHELGRLERVHFTGRISYDAFVSLLQISSLHIYLTVPFVLSWSCIEALSTGSLVLGSSTPPVREVIEDGRNGFLVDFFDHDAIATRASDLLVRRETLGGIRSAARQTVLDKYSLSRCLPEQMKLIERTASRLKS